MNTDPIGPVGLTVPPPEPLPESDESVQEETPPPESAPLPSYQGTTIDETA